jgi:hypothetical protein
MFQRYKVKIKGDAGMYRVWSIDWLNMKIQVDRAGYEWLPFSKVKEVIEENE